MSDLPSRISLREVGPRDGLQNEAPVSTAAKVELVDALSRHGREPHRDGEFCVAARDSADGRRRRGVGVDLALAFDYVLGAGAESARCGARAGRRMSGHRDRGVGIEHAQSRERESLDGGIARRHRAGDFPCARAECGLSRDGRDGVGLPLRGGRSGEPGRVGGVAGGGGRRRRALVRRHHRHGDADAGHCRSSGRCGWRSRIFR